MATRTTLLIASLCLAAVTSAFGQGLQGTGILFQEPGAGNPSSRLVGYIADRTNINPDVDLTGPLGTFKVIPTPNGSKFYLLSSGTLQTLDANLSTFRTVNGITGTIKDAQVTPNGQYLIVQSDAMYVLNTQTDAVVNTGLSLTQTVSAFTVDPNSNYVYVATLSGFAGSVVKIDLSTFQQVGTSLQLPNIVASLAVSPAGLLYAVFENAVLEINPVTMQLTNPVSFQFSAKPTPLRFTPDGKYGYLTNTNPSGPGLTSIVRINLQDHTTLQWPPFNQNQVPPTFDDVYIASSTRIFTYSPTTETLYDIDPTTFDIEPSALQPNPLFAGRILGIAISNEIPASRFLYALMDSGTSGSVLRVDLSTNTVSASTTGATSQGKLQYVSIPPSSGATSILLTNGTQVLQSGATPLPLIAQVLDALGRPVFNQAVTFTTDPTNGAVIASPSATTNVNGRVSTTVTLPATPGTYVITAQAGAATASYSLTIPGSGGVGTPGGPQLITAVIGDGTLLSELNISTVPWAPLTLLLTDANGNPRAGVPVSFTLNQGIGGIRTPTTTTDVNGMASTIYFTAPVPTGFSFINNIVRATVDSGFLDFHVTVFHQEQTSAGVGITPEISLPTPASGVITVGRGQLLNNAITARIVSSAAPQVGFPITNVGLRIGDGNDPTINGQGRCIGNTLSDNTGIATCNYQASCTLGQITENVVIGEFFGKPVKVNVVGGSASQIMLVSGDLQSGKAGQTLANLVAQVNDGCGGPVSGATVTMTLVTGSATLTTVQGTSDGNGLVIAKVQLGSAPGPVQVRFTLAGQTPLLFNLTNSVIVGNLAVQSGNGQSALINQPFGSPVVFRLTDNSGSPIGSAVVNFSVSGPGSISPLQATTAADGTVATTVTANNTTGTINVTASYSTFNTIATLTVRPQGPQITSSTFFNAASLAVGMTPCGLTTVVAPGIAPTTQGVVSGVGFGPMPYALGDIQSIYVNNVPAPLQSIANVNGRQQATFQTPCETSVGSATVRINVGGTETSVTGVPVFAAQPGIFTYAGPAPANKTYGAVIRIKDGSYITPGNLAPVGEHFYLVVTGLGQTNPGSITNSAGTGNVIAPVTVGVNNGGMVTDSARPLSGDAGVYLIEFEIPSNATQGIDQNLAVFTTVNGQIIFGNGVLIPGVGPARP